MLHFTPKIFRDEATPDAPEPGGETSPAPAPEAEVDNYGYAPAEPQPGDAPAPEKKEEAKEEPGATGYGDKKDSPEPKEPEVEGASGYGEKPPEVKEVLIEKPGVSPEGEKTLELDTGDLGEATVQQIREFAKTHGVTDKVAQALVDIRKQDLQRAKDHQAQAENDKKALRASYHNELKNDPDFGGEKFAHNIKQAEKVLHEFFPGLKKQLTERGGMLPPYVMKDLSNIANHLYSTGKVVHGGPIVDKTTEVEDESSPLDFYNQKTS
jgi:hypothetical protein